MSSQWSFDVDDMVLPFSTLLKNRCLVFPRLSFRFCFLIMRVSVYKLTRAGCHPMGWAVNVARSHLTPRNLLAEAHCSWNLVTAGFVGGRKNTSSKCWLVWTLVECLSALCDGSVYDDSLMLYVLPRNVSSTGP